MITRNNERSTVMSAEPYGHLALSANGFLFDATTGHTYTLNRSGTALLRGILDGQEATQLAEHLAESFDIGMAAAAQDTEQFLIRLKDLGILADQP
jgi:PqqD family protein of HPr-rel-A system